MSDLLQSPELRNAARNEARRLQSMAIALMAVAGITAAWFSGEHETFWVAVLVLATDLFFVTLLAIIAEQMTTLEARKRWQLSLGKLLQVTAAMGIYLGVARFAYLNSLPVGRRMGDSGGMDFMWIIVAILVFVSFPVILTACEGLIWMLVEVQKTYARRNTDDRTRTH